MKKRNRSPKRGRSDLGLASLGDMISAPDKDRLKELRNNLAQRARSTIDAQLAIPSPPWRSRPTPPKSSKLPAMSGKKIDAFRYTDSFQFWDFPTEVAVRESPPATISRANHDEFDQISSAGVGISQGGEGELLYVTVGLDFGTSSTKVVVRFPFEAGEPTVAVPAPNHCRSADHPYLWQTVLWVRGDAEFIPYPEQDARPIHGLKQGILGQDLSTSAIQGFPRLARIDAATAYLAQVIRYIRGWLILKRPTLLRGRKPVWFVNLGLPAASYDDRPLVQVYRRAAAAALMLANSSETMTLDTIRTFFQNPVVEQSARSKVDAEELGIAVIPEVAAATTGFARSPNRAAGLYLMADVGAMTLDACIFRLSRGTDEADLYPLLTADVRPLGVETFYWFRDEGRTEDEFTQQCMRCLLAVISKTKRDRDPNADCWKPDRELPVFLTGGGSRNDLHRRVVARVGIYLKQHSRNAGIRLLELPMPSTIDLPEPLAEMGRLAVAWGLSYPPTEIGEILPPSGIPDIPPPESVDYTLSLISKDQM